MHSKISAARPCPAFRVKQDTLKHNGPILVSVIVAGALALYVAWLHWITRSHDGVIRVAAERYGVDPALVKAVAWRESRFNPAARGKAGEIGLMQIRAEAAGEWAASEGIKNFLHEQCVDPGTNTLAATWYLKRALNRYNRGEDDPLPYALAEYNAGRRHVLRWKTGEASTNSETFVLQIGFPGTSNYVRQVISRRDHYSRNFKSK
jgi:soluble lytic murein transglycosylase